jgi:hypothetical protein
MLHINSLQKGKNTFFILVFPLFDDIIFVQCKFLYKDMYVLCAQNGYRPFLNWFCFLLLKEQNTKPILVPE